MTETSIMRRSLFNRIQWLVRLRWLAVVGVFITVMSSEFVLHMELPYFYLYLAITFLFLYNLFFHFCIKKLFKDGVDSEKVDRYVRLFTNVQISLDLIMLTLFIHFSGGIENPLLFYFVFHMAIAGIILSNRAAYIQATFSALLMGFITIGEFSGFLKHYHFHFLFSEQICFLNNIHSLITYIVFLTTLYIITYFVTSIANELRHGERELEEANTMLKDKDRAKSQYVKIVSHDLKSSLSTISSCLGVVLNGKTGGVSDKSLEMVKRAEHRTRTLMHFVSELWSLSRMRILENFKKQDSQISPVLEKVLEEKEELLKDKKLTLKIINKVGNPDIYVNSYLVEELFSHLLDNAIMYSLQGKTVDIRIEESSDPGFIQISIHDQGIGIPTDSQSRVFEDFYRAENAKRIHTDGTGLGLSIAKQIVEMHNGIIYVKSTLHKGCTLTFTLPKTQYVLQNTK